MSRCSEIHLRESWWMNFIDWVFENKLPVKNCVVSIFPPSLNLLDTKNTTTADTTKRNSLFNQQPIIISLSFKWLLSVPKNIFFSIVCPHQKKQDHLWACRERKEADEWTWRNTHERNPYVLWTVIEKHCAPTHSLHNRLKIEIDLQLLCSCLKVHRKSYQICLWFFSLFLYRMEFLCLKV